MYFAWLGILKRGVRLKWLQAPVCVSYWHRAARLAVVDKTPVRKALFSLNLYRPLAKRPVFVSITPAKMPERNK